MEKEQTNPKALYDEPETSQQEVQLEGFICASIREAKFGVSVDELENINAQSVNEDFEFVF